MNIDRLSQQLEDLATDELRQLEDVGAEPFTTADLIRLRGQWQVKMALYRWAQPRLLKVIAWSPALLLAGVGLFWLGWNRPALLLISLFPFCFALYGLGMWVIRKFCGTSGHLEAVDEMIEEELGRRKGN
jgi:uncharacterized iron-regulated membrane protein